MFLLLILQVTFNPLPTNACLKPQTIMKTELSQNGKDAYKLLQTADKVSFGLVGFAAQPTPLYAAYQTLLTEDAAESAFTELLSNATPAGKTYALLGLATIKPDKFKKAIEILKNNPDLNVKVKVETGGGCTLDFNYEEKSILEVVDRKE